MASISQTENKNSPVTELSLEELEQAVKIKRAEERLAELQKDGVREFKSAIAVESGIDGLYRVASSFVSRVNNIRASMKNPDEKGKRGRKSKN